MPSCLAPNIVIPTDRATGFPSCDLKSTPLLIPPAHSPLLRPASQPPKEGVSWRLPRRESAGDSLGNFQLRDSEMGTLTPKVPLTGSAKVPGLRAAVLSPCAHLPRGLPRLPPKWRPASFSFLNPRTPPGTNPREIRPCLSHI